MESELMSCGFCDALTDKVCSICSMPICVPCLNRFPRCKRKDAAGIPRAVEPEVIKRGE